MHKYIVAAAVLSLVIPSGAAAQDGTAGPAQASSASPLAGRSVPAVSYGGRRGSTRLEFRGTAAMPEASGEAKVETQRGSTRIEAKFSDLKNPTELGGEYLTYILWAISPDGRTFNLGEVLLTPNRNIFTALLPMYRADLTVTTPLQTFALVVTAEPYYSVRAPSRVVVLENAVPVAVTDVQTVEASYDLVGRNGYEPTGFRFDPLLLTTDLPPDFFQARNAVRIARAAGAETYAPDILANAQSQLERAETIAAQRRVDRRALVTASREAVQTAEDAREAAARRASAERLEAERRAAAEREAEARRQAQADLERRLKAEQERTLAEAERVAAERRRLEADRASQEARAAAEAARRAAEEAEARRAELVRQQGALEAEAARTRATAADLDLRLQEAIRDREELRARLLQQFNVILETRDTARGLVVNLSDVTFATGQSVLVPGAREKLARLSGILAAYPTLRVEVEGHTDSVGAEAYNQTLSEQRAGAVRSYLIQSGVSAQTISAVGFGEGSPVATNDTAEGRQLNRRVELIVSGELIGTEAVGRGR